jgi:hypothetical protein
MASGFDSRVSSNSNPTGRKEAIDAPATLAFHVTYAGC